MEMDAKMLNYGVPIAPGLRLALHHHAQVQLETAPQLPFGVANFGNGDFPHGSSHKQATAWDLLTTEPA